MIYYSTFPLCVKNTFLKHLTCKYNNGLHSGDLTNAKCGFKVVVDSRF